jgi:hypothetical protein
MVFMPEMARYCGRRFTVFRRADKTCVEGSGMRLLRGAVLLEGVRCDGSLHDGCQRGCLYFWKEAWLKPCGKDGRASSDESSGPSVAQQDEADPRVAGLATRHGDRYYCQSTELLHATSELPRWSLGHYFRDIANRQLSLPRFVRLLWRVAMNKLYRALGFEGYGVIRGAAALVPKGNLELQAGEWVEVRSRAEVLATVDAEARNQGLSFEIEMLEHCGQRCRVAYPIQKIISERTGKMLHLTNTVALEGVVCRGLCGKNCPRSNYYYWREIWLRRSCEAGT